MSSNKGSKGSSRKGTDQAPNSTGSKTNTNQDAASSEHVYAQYCQVPTSGEPSYNQDAQSSGTPDRRSASQVSNGQHGQGQPDLHERGRTSYQQGATTSVQPTWGGSSRSSPSDTERDAGFNDQPPQHGARESRTERELTEVGAWTADAWADYYANMPGADQFNREFNNGR